MANEKFNSAINNNQRRFSCGDFGSRSHSRHDVKFGINTDGMLVYFMVFNCVGSAGWTRGNDIYGRVVALGNGGSCNCY